MSDWDKRSATVDILRHWPTLVSKIASIAIDSLLIERSWSVIYSPIDTAPASLPP
jgi:hypothetical protein